MLGGERVAADRKDFGMPHRMTVAQELLPRGRRVFRTQSEAGQELAALLVVLALLVVRELLHEQLVRQHRRLLQRRPDPHQRLPVVGVVAAAERGGGACGLAEGARDARVHGVHDPRRLGGLGEIAEGDVEHELEGGVESGDDAAGQPALAADGGGDVRVGELEQRCARPGREEERLPGDSPAHHAANAVERQKLHRDVPELRLGADALLQVAESLLQLGTRDDVVGVMAQGERASVGNGLSTSKAMPS